MEAMRERDDSQLLTGPDQVDDAYWGGERRDGKRGRARRAERRLWRPWPTVPIGGH